MSIVVKENKTEYAVPEEGLHAAVCCDVDDLQLVTTAFGQKHMIRIGWQLETANEETGKRFIVWKRYNLSLNSKSTLRRDLETWKSKPFTQDELKNGFDLERLLNAQCQLQIAHGLGQDGTTWPNVIAVIGPPKGVPKLHVENYTRVKDRPKQQGTNGIQPMQQGEATDDDLPF